MQDRYSLIGEDLTDQRGSGLLVAEFAGLAEPAAQDLPFRRVGPQDPSLAQERCRAEAPGLRSVSQNGALHTVACHFAEDAVRQNPFRLPPLE